MRNTPIWTMFWVIVIAAIAGPQVAGAGEKEEARKHYDHAIELADEGQLEEAMIEFQRSYDLTNHFAVLYNIGQLFVSQAKPIEAVDAYERYLADGDKQIPQARRAQVEKEIQRQKTRIATLEIHGLPEGAIVSIDGKEIGMVPISSPVQLGVGTHTVSASAKGYEPAEVDVTVAGQDRKIVELRLAKHQVVPPMDQGGEKTQPPALPLPLPTPEPGAQTSVTGAVAELPVKHQQFLNSRVAGIVSGAVGVAGIAAGTVCGLVSKSRHDDAVTKWNQHLDEPAKSLQSEAHNWATAANISFIAGGSLAALGVVLYILGLKDSPDGKPDTQHTHLFPTLHAHFAGLGAGGTW